MPRMSATARQIPVLRRYHKRKVSAKEAARDLDINIKTVKSLFDHWTSGGKPGPVNTDGAKDAPEAKKDQVKQVSAKDEFS